MRKINSSRSFSHRRAIVNGKNPFVPYDMYKYEMKMLKVHQQFENAQYQIRQRYIKSHTPLPQFVYNAVIEMVDYCQSQTQPQTIVEQTPSFQEILMKSSFKELFEKISLKHASTILKEPPKSSEDWYYATGGIMSHRK